MPRRFAEEIGALLAAEAVVADFEGTAPNIAAARGLLATERTPANEDRGPAFTFPDTLPSTTNVEFVTEADDPRIQGGFAWLADEVDEVQPAAAMVIDGAIVSLCCSVPGAAAVEASLNTDERHRGRGNAVSVTAVWARAVRRSDRVPLYSTSWDNSASRAVARKLGLRMYGEDWHID
jgi:FR47-like protein